MGLDMYLNKYPRYKDATADDFNMIENYLEWKESNKNCTFEEWCGGDESKVRTDLIDFYKQKKYTRHFEWDKDDSFAYDTIFTEIAYWRKANEIHNYFVEYVQHGVDDCGTYDVSKKQLEDLLYKCKEVERIAVLEKSKVVNGYTFENGKEIPMYEDGEVIANAEEVAAILPTQGGFFFGSTDYDKYYMEDIKYTIDILEKILEETDFDTEAVCYHSSW